MCFHHKLNPFVYRKHLDLVDYCDISFTNAFYFLCLGFGEVIAVDIKDNLNTKYTLKS